MFGVFCRCCGVVCGSGSESDDDDEEELDEEEEEEYCGDPRTGCSPSGSSRTRVCGSGLIVAGPLSCRGRSSDSSIGGGSSTCIWVAVLSSAAVGMGPKSTYLDPVMLL